jgi:ABC-2 type transport system ATP-binding protein
VTYEILLEGLYKNFKQSKKQPGVWGSLKSLFHDDVHISQAIKPFDLKVKKGEIVALLGPNGAGKTTLMKMMTGIIVPSGGQASVLGYAPFERDKQFRKHIALVMGQKAQLWWDIPAYDSLQLLRAYYEIPKNLFQQRVKELAQMLDVAHLLHVHVRKLSLGERMKMELMSGLLHRPSLMFLDEPTIGLDVQAQKTMREFLKDYHRREEVTIILTSHYLADVEALCERLVLVVKGEKSFDGPLREFANLLGPEKLVTFTFSQPIQDGPQKIFFESYDPQWDNQCCEVRLRVPEEQLSSVTVRVLQEFPVCDFATEKLPIERVLDHMFSRKGV